MPLAKSKTTRGKAAKRKGSRAEIHLRNMLRGIYPTELRNNVQRVPLSGASYMKGDVYDGNDYDSCYECKCQEQLQVQEWWRQAVSQAGTSRTPILAVTQSYRPFYFIMKVQDWAEMLDNTEFNEYTDTVEFKNFGNLFDRMADLKERVCARAEIDGDIVIVIPQSFYIEVKTSIYESTRVK